MALIERPTRLPKFLEKELYCPICESQEIMKAKFINMTNSKDVWHIRFLHNCNKIKSNEPLIILMGCTEEEMFPAEIAGKFKNHIVRTYPQVNEVNFHTNVPLKYWNDYKNWKSYKDEEMMGNNMEKILSNLNHYRVLQKIYNDLDSETLAYIYSDEGSDTLIFS